MAPIFVKKNQFFPFLFDVHRLPRYRFAIVYGEKMLIMTGNLFFFARVYEYGKITT